MTLRERLGITLLLQQERPTKVEQELLRADVRSVRAAAASTSHEGSRPSREPSRALRRSGEAPSPCAGAPHKPAHASLQRPAEAGGEAWRAWRPPTTPMPDRPHW